VEAQELASCKKNAARLGAHIVFVDESGFLLIPTVRKTWAPRGQTPLLRHRYRHDRISVISGISIAPHRRRVGLYFQCHAKNIRHDEVCAFLRYLLRHLRGRVIVIWDNASIHKGERIREICRRFPRLHLELLPPYAPQLNPDEAVWAYAKGRLANGCPDDITVLHRHLRRTLRDIKGSQRRLRRCIHQSELPPFLQ
jgi:transposase